MTNLIAAFSTATGIVISSLAIIKSKFTFSQKCNLFAVLGFVTLVVVVSLVFN